MIKTPEDRKDISAIVDKWEKIIESRLDEHDVVQGQHSFMLDGYMSVKTIQELELRYGQAGWCITLIPCSHGIVHMQICRLEERNKCTD